MNHCPAWLEPILAKLWPFKVGRRLFAPDLKSVENVLYPKLWEEVITCGTAQPKKFRDAIERHWAEQKEEEDAFESLAAGKGRFSF